MNSNLKKESISNCPICNEEIEFQSRYPNRICENCINCLTDLNGKSVEFHNTDIWGGIQGIYSATGHIYSETICYFNGIECKAEEGRFGGIIFQVITP